MVQSEDACKNWLLERACKGLAVPQSLCEALLSEDQAPIDLSTFLKGGLFALKAPVWTPPGHFAQRQEVFHAGSASALLVYLEQVPVFVPKASAFSLRNSSARPSIVAK